MGPSAIHAAIQQGFELLEGARKAELIREYQRKQGDTGSSEVQIALLSERVSALTDHMRTHPRDHHSRRGLLLLVSQRRALLDYLKRESDERYKALIGRLGLRR